MRIRKVATSRFDVLLSRPVLPRAMEQPLDQIRFFLRGEEVFFMGKAYDTGNPIRGRGANPTQADTEIYERLRNAMPSNTMWALGTVTGEQGNNYRIDVQQVAPPIYGWAFQIRNDTKAHVTGSDGIEIFEPPFAKFEVHQGLNGSLRSGTVWHIPVVSIPAKHFNTGSRKIFGRQDRPGTLDQSGVKTGRHTKDASHVDLIQKHLKDLAEGAKENVLRELVNCLQAVLDDPPAAAAAAA